MSVLKIKIKIKEEEEEEEEEFHLLQCFELLSNQRYSLPMFNVTSNRNLKYEYAKALQVSDLLSNWVHPSQMPAFTSKDK